MEFGEWSGIRWGEAFNHFKVAYGAKLSDHSKTSVFDVVLKFNPLSRYDKFLVSWTLNEPEFFHHHLSVTKMHHIYRISVFPENDYANMYSSDE